MKTIRYNTETGKYTVHSEQYKTMDGKPGRIDPPHVQLELVEIDKPQYNQQSQKLKKEYIFEVNPPPHDLYGINGTATESYTVMDYTEYELAVRDWVHPEYKLRIVAPVELIMQDIGIKMYVWFQLNNLPVEKVNGGVHLYCNEILTSHQSIIDGLEGVITIEDYPEE
jgi:hypothetical protein